MVSTEAYKKALKTGVRQEIVAEARSLVGAVGKLPLPADSPNVNATAGADNSAEKQRYQAQFNKQALSVSATVDGFNDKLVAGADPSAEAVELVTRVQALESTHAAISEIERIDAGDSFGTGGGLPTPGTPSWAMGLIADVKAIKAKVGA